MLVFSSAKELVNESSDENSETYRKTRFLIEFTVTSAAIQAQIRRCSFIDRRLYGELRVIFFGYCLFLRAVGVVISKFALTTVRPFYCLNR